VKISDRLKLTSVHFAYFSPQTEEWLLWRFSVTFLPSFAFVFRLETFSYYVVALVSVLLLVGTVSQFALYKGLFATHYIALVESPSSVISSF